MSRNRVYWAVADAAMTAFRFHAATPSHEQDEIYPCAVANHQGEILMVWQVGPMATKGTATVKWARYHPDGRPTGEVGVVGQSSSGTKATAFVGTDDNFYILTTAR